MSSNVKHFKSGDKTACFTDIHWGKKNNSEQHNQDCFNFILWFCEQVRKDASITNVIFLGDWFENRSALNISTMNWSYKGAKALSDLNIPVYFIIGNHDLYHRNTRDVYSPVNFREFANFTVIDQPLVVKEIGDGVLLCPFLFHEEYPSLSQYTNIGTWWGHFEFRGFVVTGQNMLMPSGPDATLFKQQKRIFSGHFHKRQTQGNVTYIGNTFPMDFGDVGDSNRGMMVYDHHADSVEFIQWIDSPNYVYTKLSLLLDGEQIKINSYVKCLVDESISFQESIALRESMIKQFSLRDFSYIESNTSSDMLTTGGGADVEDLKVDISDEDIGTIDSIIISLLNEIESTDKLDKNLLIEEYKKLI